MNEGQYASLSAPFRGKPASALLRGADKVLTLLFYALYPLLVLLLAIGCVADSRHSASFDPLLIPCIVVPAVGFLAVSIIRKAVNTPRPYEALDISPIIVKDTKGQSFPSKHVFSSFCIAMCWLAYCPPVGCILLACSTLIAAIRVIGGVHWPRDVFAAALFGIIVGGCVMIW